MFIIFFYLRGLISHRHLRECPAQTIVELSDEYYSHNNNKKVKVCFYVAQYPELKELYTFPPLVDLFIPTPTRLFLEAF